jgi:hypothetical protein
MCHGGLYAHNIEYDMISQWETMRFCRFDRDIMRDFRHDNYMSTSMAKGFGLSLDDKDDDDDELSQSNLGSTFRSWSFLFIGLSISLFSTKFI